MHEMLISLTVMSGVIALAGHLATGQLRLFRDIGEVAAVKAQVGHASAIAAALLWGASPRAGDIIVAQDSAVEFRKAIGSAVSCGGAAGRIVVPAPVADRGNVLAAFIEPPGPGDRAAALFHDSIGTTWMTVDLITTPVATGPCVAFPRAPATLTILTAQAIEVPPGSALRFTRPIRLSLYRSSDGLWYLGGRDWNGEAARFNPIQPLAGPLIPYNEDPSRTGLHFSYRDREGRDLAEPVDAGRIATIVVTARAVARAGVRVPGLAGQQGGLEDSALVVVALRNAR
jgi:hypothetical protein